MPRNGEMATLPADNNHFYCWNFNFEVNSLSMKIGSQNWSDGPTKHSQLRQYMNYTICPLIFLINLAL